jgi:hypothetical protein
VPRATFIQGDVTTLDWPAASFEAIVALYSILHVPLPRQPALLASMARWLIDDGILLLTAGAQAWTGSQVGWLGGTDQMWWSQADATTYRRWLDDAGFTVISEAYVPDGDGGHSLFWAIRHRGASAAASKPAIGADRVSAGPLTVHGATWLRGDAFSLDPWMNDRL